MRMKPETVDELLGVMEDQVARLRKLRLRKERLKRERGDAYRPEP
jgi:hypothetical protein